MLNWNIHCCDTVLQKLVHFISLTTTLICGLLYFIWYSKLLQIFVTKFSDQISVLSNYIRATTSLQVQAVYGYKEDMYCDVLWLQVPPLYVHRVPAVVVEEEEITVTEMMRLYYNQHHYSGKLTNHKHFLKLTE